MNFKNIFLELNEEIISGGNPNRRILSNEENRILNYRSGISSAIRQENRGKETQFFVELNKLYKETEFPFLSISGTLLLFKKFNTNAHVFDFLFFTIKQIGRKPFIRDHQFWEHYLHFFVLNSRDDLKTKQPYVIAFSKIAKLLFKDSNYTQYNILFGYLLDHSKYRVLRSLTHYNLGSNILGHLASEGGFKSLGSLLKLFSILKKANANPKVFEIFLIQFANNKKNYFAHDEQFRFFLILFVKKFPVKFLNHMNALDLEKLYLVYQCNSKLFENFNVEDCSSFKQVDSVSYGSLRSEIVNYLLSNYGISFFFINNFNDDKLTSDETKWFKDVVSGKNLVYSDHLPFPLSKKLVHKFNTVANEWKKEAIESNYVRHENWSQAIQALTVRDGLIWSALVYEIKNVQFANESLNFISRIENTEFWVKVIVQLYRNGLRTHNYQITEIFDYIEHQVFQLRRSINFKTKKIANLAAESDEWHQAVGSFKYGKLDRLLKLPKSSIQPFNLEENNKKYIIRQILSNRELAFEGGELGHCVGSYTNRCMTNGTYIFSLREIEEYTDKEVTEDGEIDTVQSIEKSLITIEVNGKFIFQKRGKKNRRCLPFEDRIIKIWAKENGLSFRTY